MKALPQFLERLRRLRPDVKQAVRREIRRYLERVRFVHDPQRLYHEALAVLKFRFPHLIPGDWDVLAGYLVGLAAGLVPWDGNLGDPADQDQENSIKEQTAMERSQKFGSALTAILGKLSDESAPIVENVK